MKPLSTLLALACLLGPGPAHADGPPPRVAVVVGANQAPAGRKPLLFSHRDADTMAEVLASVGGFARADITVLKDPSPDGLMSTLVRAVSRLAGKPRAVLYFYYSGHADEGALYPAGQALALAPLRRIMDEAEVAMKIGLVDACRGGGWTRAKGLIPDQPFAVPLTMESEGSVLIASSSGLESAHESDQLQGSFFTFHFAAGLRGAADSNGNREVTLTEAFEYAKERTIRDTLRLAHDIQHPSYAINLRGRRDLVLASIDRSPSSVEIAVQEGPLQLIHVDSGLALVELPPGRRQVRVAVPPGRYLLRKTTPAGNLVQEVKVLAGLPSFVDEQSLILVGSERLAIKTAAGPPGITVEALPPRRPSRAIRNAAWATVGATVLAGALTYKFGLDVKNANVALDSYRRFICPSGLCDAWGNPAAAITDEQNAYVNAKKAYGQGRERLQYGAALVTGAAAVTAGYLFWRAYRSPYLPPVEIVPATATDAGLAPGLTLALRL